MMKLDLEDKEGNEAYYCRFQYGYYYYYDYYSCYYYYHYHHNY